MWVASPHGVHLWLGACQRCNARAPYNKKTSLTYTGSYVLLFVIVGVHTSVFKKVWYFIIASKFNETKNKYMIVIKRSSDYVLNLFMPPISFNTRQMCNGPCR